MQVFLAIHIFGSVFWLGTLILLPNLLKTGARGEGITQFVKRSFFGLALPGAAITLLAGIVQFFLRGSGYYLSQGWFHAKVTCVVILFAMTWLLYAEVKKYLQGEEPKRKVLVAVHAVSSVMLLLIVLFVFRVFM